MPKIAELRAFNKEVWCKVLIDKDDNPITLWTDDEIRQHDEELLRRFVLDQVEQFLEKRNGQPVPTPSS